MIGGHTRTLIVHGSVVLGPVRTRIPFSKQDFGRSQMRSQRDTEGVTKVLCELPAAFRRDLNTGGGNRTHTGLPPEDFKSSASLATKPSPDVGYGFISNRFPTASPPTLVESDPELARVIDRWPHLSRAMKAGILAMVQAAANDEAPSPQRRSKRQNGRES